MEKSATSEALTGIQKYIADNVTPENWLGTGSQYSAFRFADPSLADVALRVPNSLLSPSDDTVPFVDAAFDAPTPNLKQTLLNSTMLTPPSMIYQGDAIGQTLLHVLGKNTEPASETHADPWVDTRLSIIRREPGISLHRLLESLPEERGVFFHAELKPHVPKLLEQIASLAWNSPYYVDINLKNIVYDPEHGLHQIDAFQSITSPAAPFMRAWQSMSACVDILMHTAGSMPASHEKALRSELMGMCQETIDALATGRLEKQRSSGFGEVHGVEAIAATENVHALRAKLDALQQHIAGGARG